jgi:hypothetical protein
MDVRDNEGGLARTASLQHVAFPRAGKPTGLAPCSHLRQPDRSGRLAAIAIINF